MTDKLTAKDRHRETIIEYLSNPENPFLNRTHIATNLLGFSQQSVLYIHFTPAELAEIELEALNLRRKCYAVKLAKVDKGLLDKAAAEGGAAEAKLVYERFEGWNPKKTVVLDGALINQIFTVLPPEIAEQVKQAIVIKQKELAG